MATKKELLQAQTFSRRRLLTAFVSGAPGGRELEPAKPLRGIVVGGVLSVLIVVGSLIAGAFTGQQDDQWKVNSLVILRESGARYVAINGQLYPVHNVTSARLLAFADSFDVINLREDQAQEVPRGNITVGIPGAPDALPPVNNLINSGWTSCAMNAQAVRTRVSANQADAEVGRSMLVRNGQDHYYLHEGVRYEIAADDVNAFSLPLRFESDPDAAAEVGARWLNLFTEGARLRPLSMEQDGQVPPGPVADIPTDLLIGDVVQLRDGQGNLGEPHVINAEGNLVPLNPFALELYFLGSGRGSDSIVDLSFTEAQSVQRATPEGFVPQDWPEDIPIAMEHGLTPCVQLQRDGENGEPELHLADAAEGIGDDPVTVDSGHGALVRLQAGGAQAPWAIIDEQGILYQIPPGHPVELERLRYHEVEAPTVQAAWAELFTPGPTLTIEAAIEGLPGDAASTASGADPGGQDPEDDQ